MTTRADVDRLSKATARAVELAQADLSAFLATLDLTKPETVRDELLDFVPQLVTTYGDVAATASADWYEQVRADALSSTYTATLADGATPDQVQGSVRYSAGSLFTDAPLDVLLTLNGALQRYVSFSGRQTVARNAEHDPAHPRFARVPRGGRTCAFCSLLASRGWVYHSERTAGLEHEYHDHCHCQIVPEWNKGQAHIEGYDPNAMYAIYQHAAEIVGGTHDPQAILAVMRRQFPDHFTDGVINTAA